MTIIDKEEDLISIYSNHLKDLKDNLMNEIDSIDSKWIIESLAETGTLTRNENLKSLSWSLVSKIITLNFYLYIKNYMEMGDQALIDLRINHLSNSKPKTALTSNQVQNFIDQIIQAIKKFSNPSNHHPAQKSDSESLSPNLSSSNHQNQNHLLIIQAAPFTIQRLAQLVAPQADSSSIHPHYSTLPKYLRAIQRVLSVSSTLGSFPINSSSSNSTQPSNPSIPLPDQTILHSNGDHIPITYRTSRPLTSTPVTPILSPIPWLLNSSPPPDGPLSDGHSSPHTSPIPSVSLQRPPTPPLVTHSSSSPNRSGTIKESNSKSLSHTNLESSKPNQELIKSDEIISQSQDLNMEPCPKNSDSSESIEEKDSQDVKMENT